MSKTASRTSPAAELLTPIDLRFAGLMARLSADAPEVRLAAALASHYRRLGHICIDLEELDRKPPLPEILAAAGFDSWPKSARLLPQLRSAPVVGQPGEFKPLVLDSRGRLYLHRYWKYETDLAVAVTRLAKAAVPAPDPEKLRQGLARLFPQTRPGEIDWQMIAAFAASRRQLCLISGGPGTGKTRTVVVLLALVLEQNPAARIALAAPTGKAAARLQESVRNAKATLACAPEISARLPEEASTLHRLLGYRPDSAYFRHDAQNPLPCDVIVVDEASMVDLALMAKLVAAVPPAARLILVGDKDQLASVEAGAVLADLCNAGQLHRFSAGFVQECVEFTGQALPPQPAAAATSDLADCLVELRRNYRFGEQSGIFQLSQAVNQGDAESALALLQGTGAADSPVSREPLPAPAALKTALQPLVLAHYQDYLHAKDPLPALQSFSRFRILCALRNGPYGVENLNRLVEEILTEAGLIAAGAQFYAGRPVMVVRNDYNLRLFNGDIGIILDQPPKGLRACFAGADGATRDLLPLRLPEHETAYALTVHKSQGSEFERVLLVLPGEDSAVLTRELVYTGLTRASREIQLWAPESILATAIRRQTTRRSGLRDALWI